MPVRQARIVTLPAIATAVAGAVATATRPMERRLMQLIMTANGRNQPGCHALPQPPASAATTRTGMVRASSVRSRPAPADPGNRRSQTEKNTSVVAIVGPLAYAVAVIGSAA